MEPHEPSPVLGDAGAAGEPSPTPIESGSPVAQESDWRTTIIPEDLREDKIFADIKTPQDAMRMLHNSQKLIGKDKVVTPTADSAPEVWDAFYKAGGRPDDVEGYKLSEEFGDDKLKLLDSEAVDAFKKVAMETGMSNAAFEKQMAWYADYMQSSMASAEEATNTQVAEGLTALRKEWTGDDFDTNMGVAQAALEQIGDEQLTELVMGDKALRNNPSVIKLFHRIGASMQDHAPLAVPNGGVFKLDGVTHAKQELAKFEDLHKDVLFNNNYQGPKNREDILSQRFKILQAASPERSSVADVGGGEFREFEVRI